MLSLIFNDRYHFSIINFKSCLFEHNYKCLAGLDVCTVNNMLSFYGSNIKQKPIGTV